VAGSAIYTVGQVVHLGIDISPTVNFKIIRSNYCVAPFSFHLFFLPGSFGIFISYRCPPFRFNLLFSNISSVKRSVHYQRGVKASRVHCVFLLIFFIRSAVTFSAVSDVPRNTVLTSKQTTVKLPQNATATSAFHSVCPGVLSVHRSTST